ncbi:MAG: hypothetical protein NUW37_02150 [Planctomycetes bacterium]|nr:hypothetical protein [Planctomycetota bacterium]
MKYLAAFVSVFLLLSSGVNAQEADGDQPAQNPPANPGANDPGEPDQAKVDDAIQRGVKYVIDNYRKVPFLLEARELMLLTMVHGKQVENRVATRLLQDSIEAGYGDNIFATINIALKAVVLEAVDPIRFQRNIAQCAWWLVNAQTDDGEWDYVNEKAKGLDDERTCPRLEQIPQTFDPPATHAFVKDFIPGLESVAGAERAQELRDQVDRGRRTGARNRPSYLIVHRTQPSFSNTMSLLGGGKSSRNMLTTQYALLGLHAAIRANVAVPKSVFKLTERMLMRAIDADTGGYPYIPSYDSGNLLAANHPHAGNYDTGTCAAMGCWGVVRAYLGESDRDPKGEEILGRGLHRMGEEVLVQEEPWVDRRLHEWPSVAAALGNAGRGSTDIQMLYYYYIYSLERTGEIGGWEEFGGRNWYNVGADELIKIQNPDGSWGDGEDWKVINTCYAVLFLEKATPSIPPELREEPRYEGPITEGPPIPQGEPGDEE